MYVCMYVCMCIFIYVCVCIYFGVVHGDGTVYMLVEYVEENNVGGVASLNGETVYIVE